MAPSQTTINLPIYSLSQVSGTEKSKLAVEANKSGLGFHIFLQPSQSSYRLPFKYVMYFLEVKKTG
jgi:hypothetical protein